MVSPMNPMSPMSPDTISHSALLTVGSLAARYRTRAFALRLEENLIFDIGLPFC